MFCEKCGEKLDDAAIFCEKCGNRLENNSINSSNIADDIIQLTVKPTYKFFYIQTPLIILFICFVLLTVLPVMSYGVSISLSLLAGWGVLFGIIIAIKSIINKKQYNSYEYSFYKTKVAYKDSFVNLSQKEIKYKNFREIVISQTYTQRLFNLGNIILYTNATGLDIGISMKNIENPQEIYKQLKSLIDI